MVKKILLLLLVLLIIVGAVGFYVLSQPPKESLSNEFKEEAVTKLLGRKAQLNPVEVKKGNAKFEGKYITFEYPAKALIYTYRDENSKNNTEDENFSFDIKSPKTVFNMKNSPFSQSLGDFPSVRLREERSYEYKKTEITANGVKGVAYFKGGFESEKSGFFITNGRIYTISVTGIVEKEVEKLFDDIVLTVYFLPSN